MNDGCANEHCMIEATEGNSCSTFGIDWEGVGS